MNTFDLNVYRVQEMSHQEMVETNGGSSCIFYDTGKAVGKAIGRAARGLVTGIQTLISTLRCRCDLCS